MNEVLKAIETRRSIREFSAKEVSREDLDMILKAGTYAPSGMNRQPVIFVAVTDKETRDELSEMNARIMGTDSDPFYGAQTVIVVLADKTAPTYVYDGALAMGNLMLAAHSLGIGSCWIHRAKEEFDSPEGRELLKKWGITGDYEGIGHCILGYADGEEPADKPRRDGTVYHV
ncbi:MAG: nitroreductase family protein [Clostridiales bacterium]|jgi:nitroreductase|nr:nitroreductase family protein [Clostridiales bacterium]